MNILSGLLLMLSLTCISLCAMSVGEKVLDLVLSGVFALSYVSSGALFFTA